MPAMIWDCVERLGAALENRSRPVVLTSGGWDVCHRGHIYLIQESAKLGELIVLLNGDGFLLRKKGYVYLPVEDRLAVMSNMENVSHVVLFDDETQFVDRAIKVLKPDFFCRGGDRSTPESIAECEHEACREVGCKIVYGVGGKEKIQSSSWIHKQYKRQTEQ